MEFDLVFEGGGAKGTAFVGALREFERRGHAARRLVGTSAGAITAATYAAGLTPAEMETTARERTATGAPVFTGFMDTPSEKSLPAGVLEDSLTYETLRKVDLPGPFDDMLARRIMGQLIKVDAYRSIFCFVEQGGLYAGDAFAAWIREQLESKGAGLGSATFSEFHATTGRDLSLVVTDTTSNELRVLNHRTAPACPVAAAVRMSMSIPFVWKEVRWQPQWGSYLGQSIDDHRIVDGGVLSNFPLELVTSSDAETVAVMGADVDPDAAGSLGFLIDEQLEVPGSGKPAAAASVPKPGLDLKAHARRLRTLQRINRLVDTMTSAHDRRVIQAHPDKVCRLPARGYGTTEFGMSDARMKALIRAGEEATRRFFDGDGG